MLTISKFKSDIMKRGVLRTNRFEARFAPPKFLNSRELFPALYGKFTPEDLTVRCEAASTPGVSLQTVEGPFRYGYGSIDKQPVGVIYEPLTLTFLCDRDGQTHKFFHLWMNMIYTFSTGGMGADGSSPITIDSDIKDDRGAYEMQYKSNYATDLFIDIYDEFDQKVIAYRAYKVYPERLNNLELNWGETDSVVRLQIPMIYKDYDVKYPKIDPSNNQNPFHQPTNIAGSSPHSAIPNEIIKR